MKTGKRKREPLSRERILQAALAIVDRDGLQAISMRRLGDELGVEAMSLYNHVANKAAILDGIFETVLGELPAVRQTSSWQATLRARAFAFRTVLSAHPNALPIFGARPAVTPASIAHVEAVLAVLRGAGFSVADALGSLQVLVAFVVGHTVATCSPDDDASPSYDALSEDSFPHIHEMARILDGRDIEKEFELGLEAMLTGLEARLERRQASRSR